MDSKPFENNGHARHESHATPQADSENGQGRSDGHSPTEPAPTTDETHEAGTPGAFDTRPIENVLRRPVPDEPQKVWNSVLDAVTSSRDETAALTNLHRQRYDSPSFPGAEAPLLAGLLGPCKNHLAEVNSYLTSLKRRAAATDPFIDDAGDGTAWTTFDLIKVTFLSLVSFALLAIGVITLSQILLASGLPGFEDPLRRYLFSCVPIGGAFALKNIGSRFTTDLNRRRYISFVQIAGALLAIAWSALFVTSFDSGPISSADDVLADLMAESSAAENTADTGTMLLFVGLLAEMFLAAGCWLEIECIVTSHRRANRSPNPLRVAIDKQISRWTSRFVKVQALAAQLEARLKAIESGRAAYITSALNEYRLRRRGLSVAESAATPNGAIVANGQPIPLRHHYVTRRAK